MSNKGFSLIELVVVMGIFIGIMLIMSTSFQNIFGQVGQQMKSASTNTEGIIGLEMLRSDLENVGFGLPWSFSIPPAAAYPEVASSTDPVSGIDSASFNEPTAAQIVANEGPRAILLDRAPSGNKIIDGSGNTNPLSAYLVIKATNVALSNPTAKKWAFVKYSANSAGVNQSRVIPRGPTAENLTVNDRVITISSTFTNSGVAGKRLVMASAANFFYSLGAVPPVEPPDIAFKPADPTQYYLAYGIDSTDITMPYNRVDYYVKKKSAAAMPASCNPGTGILYKGGVQQGTGSIVEYPLLNCVGDMQVEFELDPNNDGNFTYTPNLTGLTSTQIRSQLKNIRVYILSHEGKKDRSYSYSNSTIQVGDPARTASSGRTWDGAASCTGDSCMQLTFGPDWKRYRWKVYTIVVHPKNLD